MLAVACIPGRRAASKDELRPSDHCIFSRWSPVPGGTCSRGSEKGFDGTLTADAKIFINMARLECQSHKLSVEDPVTVEYITRFISSIKQMEHPDSTKRTRQEHNMHGRPTPLGDRRESGNSSKKQNMESDEEIINFLR
ncbi:hypothetical protein AAFF_G00240350 [Aldrovandia affinis]|uniref:Uncharacterized protein n=1 Tax=Aldrovandia affinis TaxID=143900 RepID=A0AAD7SUF0_9TELE|nr:hypothetical protein AAFF_G00240350 [Aldrovandia affinis]